jgi:hypothetical protein
MSYEPSFSKRPGGAASRPRFFSLLGLGSDTGESGAPSLKVIIDDESNPPSSRDAGSAVSLLRALDSAGDQVTTCDSSFPPKPQTPTQKHQSVSPVAQKFGRRAAVENKPKGEILVFVFYFHFHLLVLISHIHLAVLSPSKSNQFKDLHSSASSNLPVQSTPPKKSSPPHKHSTAKPASPRHPVTCVSPVQKDQPQSQQPGTNENEVPVSSSVVSPNVATMKPSNVKFGFSKFGFSFSKPKVASPKQVKSSIPSALGSPIAASIATPRLPEQEVAQDASSAALEITSPLSKPVDTPALAHVNATENSAVTHAPALAPHSAAEVKPQHVVGLSTRAQQLMAELAAEDESFGALDFLEPAKKEKRVLIEKSSLVRKNVKNGLKHAAPNASVVKYDVAEPPVSRTNLSKPLAPQINVPAAGIVPTLPASTAVPVDSKQVEQLKRTIDNLKSQLDAARNSEKKIVTLENQLAEQNGLVESMRKEIR